MINYAKIEFVDSVFAIKQLPEPLLPEIAFAGRSNVGKSSLINKMVNQRKLVKVSSRPGKTQSLNFFLVDQRCYLVDLPGCGYAKVPKKLKGVWQGLISDYIAGRETLRCVVVIIDIRHPLKELDLNLVSWLRDIGVAALPVYTKLDKITRGQRQKHAAALDAGLNIDPADRLLFSAKTGEGKDELIARLEGYLHLEPPSAAPHPFP
jgi:GTP-binding protein